MIKGLLLTNVLLLCWMLVPSYGYNYSDSTKVREMSTAPISIHPEPSRTFENITLAHDLSPVTDPIVVSHVLADSTNEQRNYAHSLLDRIQQEQRFLESLDGLSEVELPVGVGKPGGIIDYSIIIDRITANPKGAVLDAYVSLALPQTGDRIAFHGKIPLSAKGGITGSAKVYLLGDHQVRLSEKTLLIMKGTNSSYVEFDCNGFKGVSIQAEVQFSRELIIPEDAKGNQLPTPERVKVQFTTYAQSLNDIMLGVVIPPFQVNGLPNVSFVVSQAYMDWSDLANPPNINFPKDYTSPFLTAGHETLWQGFSLQRLEVRLPPAFKKTRHDNSRVSIGLEHVILDDQGFTGAVFANNLLSQGDMNGWSYSLDHVGIELVINHVKGFSLAGKISMPMVKTKEGKVTQFAYQAQRGADGNYIFAVTVQNELKMDVWAADVKLFTGSGVMVKEREGKFYPSAILNGELTINALGNGPKVKFNSIRFERMIISSEAPHFTPGTFGFGREGEASEVSKFPLVISGIQGKSESDRVGLAFDVTINIGGKPQEGGFGGTASVVVWGKEEQRTVSGSEGQAETQEEWKFDKVELSGVGINIKKPGVYELAGTIKFYDNDPVYGDGFKGAVKGSFGKVGKGVNIMAEAMFGRTATFRYWYADAMVKMEQGILLAPGISAYGFGGGFFSKMKQDGGSAPSPSGVKYVPDENVTGLKALMLIGTPGRPEAFNGMITFQIVLNRNGGINTISLDGNARFMSGPVDKLMDKIKENAPAAVQGKATNKLLELMAGQVYGNVNLLFDNVNDIFHGNIAIYVNVAGGLVRGVSDGNKAGWATIHFAQDEWYILIGTPDQPVGLEVARIFKTESYFMMGDNLPGSPPPPRQVTEILGPVDLNYMRDFNTLKSGLGFAFGLHFIVDTGNLNFLMFYGRFAAGTGIDFMLKNYGENYHCQGSSGPMGINGWYANGQAYAFVMGKIGIKVNLKFYKGNYDILSIGAAAVLQAKGPNPFWMKGTVGGYYRILGGLVKGHCRFEVTIGKDCKPVGEENVLGGVNIIAGMTPADNSKDVDVFNEPQVAFNIPVGQEFEITDLENKTHYFRARLDQFDVLDGQTPLPGELRWNADNNVVVFDGRDILPGQKKLKAKARLLFEEKTYGGWSPVRFEGKIVEENKEVSFETGKEPDFIPPNNVVITYPIVNQQNFYKDEYNKGFIQLKDGQPRLFDSKPEWVQKLRFTNVINGQYVEGDISYNVPDKRVNFDMPGGILNNAVYRFDVLNIPRQRTVIDANVKKVETELKLGQTDGGGDTLTTKQIEGQLVQLGIKTLYTNQFRTSRYNTFADKIDGMKVYLPSREPIEPYAFRLKSFVSGPENLEYAELSGGANFAPLIQMEAIVKENTWYENYVYPLVYEGYPLLNKFKLTVRTDPGKASVFGIPPVKDIYFGSINTHHPQGIEDLLNPFGALDEYAKVIYNLGESVNTDYKDLLNQVANHFVSHPGTGTLRLTKFFTALPPFTRYGHYKIKIIYAIPGVDRQPTSRELDLFNDIPDPK